MTLNHVKMTTQNDTSITKSNKAHLFANNWQTPQKDMKKQQLQTATKHETTTRNCFLRLFIWQRWIRRISHGRQSLWRQILDFPPRCLYKGLPWILLYPKTFSCSTLHQKKEINEGTRCATTKTLPASFWHLLTTHQSFLTHISRYLDLHHQTTQLNCPTPYYYSNLTYYTLSCGLICQLATKQVLWR